MRYSDETFEEQSSLYVPCALNGLGRERAKVAAHLPLPQMVNPRVFLDFAVDNQPLGRLVSSTPHPIVPALTLPKSHL